MLQIDDMWKRRNHVHKAVYEYFPESRSVKESGRSTPWWLVDYLARRSGKHIVQRKKPPSPSEVERSLNELERKLGWAAHFDKHGSSMVAHGPSMAANRSPAP